VKCSFTNYRNLAAFEVLFLSADCDGCGGRFSTGSSFHGCRACNFDLCHSCYTKAAAAAGPSMIAEPMSALQALAESAAGRLSLQSSDSGRNPRTSIDVGPMSEAPKASSDAATQTNLAASEARAVSDMACQTDFATDAAEAAVETETAASTTAASTNDTSAQESTTVPTMVDLVSPEPKSAVSKTKKKQQQKNSRASIDDQVTPDIAAWKAASVASPTSSAVDLAADAPPPSEESGFSTPVADTLAASRAPNLVDSAPPTVYLAPYPEPTVAAPASPLPPPPPPPVPPPAVQTASAANTIVDVEQAVVDAIFRLRETVGMDFDFEVECK